MMTDTLRAPPTPEDDRLVAAAEAILAAPSPTTATRIEGVYGRMLMDFRSLTAWASVPTRIGPAQAACDLVRLGRAALRGVYLFRAVCHEPTPTAEDVLEWASGRERVEGLDYAVGCIDLDLRDLGREIDLADTIRTKVCLERLAGLAVRALADLDLVRLVREPTDVFPGPEGSGC